MLKCEFEKGQMILYEGDIGQSIYIIKYGNVKCFKGEKQVRFLDQEIFLEKVQFYLILIEFFLLQL